MIWCQALLGSSRSLILRFCDVGLQGSHCVLLGLFSLDRLNLLLSPFARDGPIMPNIKQRRWELARIIRDNVVTTDCPFGGRKRNGSMPNRKPDQGISGFRDGSG